MPYSPKSILSPEEPPGAITGLRQRLFLLACLSLFVSGLGAQASTSPEKAIFAVPGVLNFHDASVDRLGSSLEEIISEFGAPDAMFPFRGLEGWHDTVVFYYEADHFYFFWWDNRVWQVRYDRRFESDFGPFRMGMVKTAIRAQFGLPVRETENELIYQLPDRGYPVHIKLVFTAGKLTDYYCYRADF